MLRFISDLMSKLLTIDRLLSLQDKGSEAQDSNSGVSKTES